MAKGRPDWTSSINITGQDLAEVISRPKYGSAESALYLDTIAEGSSDTLFTITGTGMIYGGHLYHYGSFPPSRIQIKIVIDGTTIDLFDIYTLNAYQIENEGMWYMYEQYFSEEYDKFIQGITRGITFEEDFSIEVSNASGSGASDTIDAKLWYALI